MESLFAALASPGSSPALAILLYASLWLAGGVFASFAGLVASRIGSVDEGGSALRAVSVPASHCDGCGRRLGVADLVPVAGWLLSRGRCRCGSRIPAVYPASEMLVGTATAAAPFLLGDGAAAAAWIFLLWAGTLVSLIDLKEHVIPEELTWAVLFAGLLLSPFESDPWLRSAGAAACCGAMWLSLSLAGWLRGLDARAGGDVAMAAAAGAWTGLGGSPAFLLIASAAFILHAAPARLRGIEWVPMGPSLVVALLAAVVLDSGFGWFS